MDEIDVLSKRFKDFIDKVQDAYDKADNQKPDSLSLGASSGDDQSVKLYTVVSPVDAMANSLKSVLHAIDTAIDNIDKIKHLDNKEILNQYTDKVTEVLKPVPDQKKFTEEELEFLVRTFNCILNSTEEEREKLFKQIDKDDLIQGE